MQMDRFWSNEAGRRKKLYMMLKNKRYIDSFLTDIHIEMGTYLQRYQQDDRNVLSASEVLIVIKAILQLQTII